MRRSGIAGFAGTSGGGHVAMAGQRDGDKGPEDDASRQVSIEELGEFLEGDLLDVPARPEFKERLRRKLWGIVRSRAVNRPRDPDRR